MTTVKMGSSCTLFTPSTRIASCSRALPMELACKSGARLPSGPYKNWRWKRCCMCSCFPQPSFKNALCAQGCFDRATRTHLQDAEYVRNALRVSIFTAVVRRCPIATGILFLVDHVCFSLLHHSNSLPAYALPAYVLPGLPQHAMSPEQGLYYMHIIFMRGNHTVELLCVAEICVSVRRVKRDLCVWQHPLT